MGLDMYLYGKKYLSEYTNKEQHAAVAAVFPDMDPESVSSVWFEVGYWRKANSIHQWFVDNCQGGVDKCQLSYVSMQDLAQLKELCTEVIDHPEMAAETLPTTGGFFFGSTEYDEWYFRNIEHTLSVIQKAEELVDKGFSFYYRSSW